MSAADGLLQSVYRFHVYYQIRRILVEIQTPLPQDQAWDAVNNPYDRRGYERICHEFGVPQHSDWKVGGPNQGLGRVYNYSTYIGYHPFADGEYDSSDMSFTQRTTTAFSTWTSSSRMPPEQAEPGKRSYLTSQIRRFFLSLKLLFFISR